jgi:hypothetical protein
MIPELISFGFAIIFILYIRNPNDIFKIQANRYILQEKITLIDKDTDTIIRIFKDLPDGKPIPENITLIAEKFSQCYKYLNRSKSSFYRFLASTSYMAYLMLDNVKLGPFPDDAYDEFSQNIYLFLSGIQNKDLVTCYKSTANFLYLSSMRKIPLVKPNQFDFDFFDTIEKKMPNFAKVNNITISTDEIEKSGAILYLFYIHLNHISSNCYDYSRLQVYKEDVITNETAIIKKLFKNFRTSYTNSDFAQQCKILMNISDDSMKIEEYINPMRIFPEPSKRREDGKFATQIK